MKVAIFTAYPPNRGRLSEYAEALVSSLRRKGVKVLVLSDSVSGPCSKRIWSMNRPVNPLRIFIEVARYRPDILHFNLHFAVFGRGRLMGFIGFLSMFIASIMVRSFLRIRCLVTLHNIPEAIDVSSYGIKDRFYNRMGFAIARKLALISCPVVVTLKLYERMLKGMGFKRVHWVPHGCWALAGNDDPSLRRNLIVFIGHISPSKDLQVLVDTVRLLRREGEDILLAVVGAPHPSFEEEGRKQLEILEGSPDVIYLGYVDMDDLPTIISRALCVVLPYKTPTGSSGVLHLVSGAGLPVVAVDSPEFRELDREGAGLLLAPLSPRGMADAVKSLLDERRWNELSRRSRAYAAGRSWEKVAEIYLKVYRAIVSGA